MFRSLVFSLLAFGVCASLPCVAQELVPVIHLSADEGAKASQLAQAVKAASDRDAKAKMAWKTFYETYQAAHPQLPGMRFTSDFRFAVGKPDRNEYDPRPAKIVQLTKEERDQLEALNREVVETARGLKEAANNWLDY